MKPLCARGSKVPRRKKETMKNLAIIIAAALFLAALSTPRAAEPQSVKPAATSPESLRSPANQVFQFMQAGTCTWSNGKSTAATAYLWIPGNCQRLRGLVVMGANVPEHMLAGHLAIRKACEAHDMGILFATPSFLNDRVEKWEASTVAFLQQLLDGLAQSSGYAEVATVPWLPMGESGHLRMVDALVGTAPERCIAGVWIKNSHWWQKHREVPMLTIYGTAQEWSQDKTDIRKNWNNNITKTYEGVLDQRKRNPGWPFSYVIDGTSGHFDCSERLTQYIAHYIDCVAQARLSADGSPALKPVAIEKGYLADLPVPGHENKPIAECGKIAPESRGLPWYFDRASAEEAQAIARINWNAETQLPGFADANGKVFPYVFNGISWLPINRTNGTSWKPEGANSLPTPLLVPEADGITFTLKGVLMDKIPVNFLAAGEPLAKAPGTPSVEWLCGSVEPVGGDKFRVALDRTWPAATYLAVRHPGTDKIRAVVQPAQLSRESHIEGIPQKITFEKIPNVKAGTPSVELVAKTDAGMPVKFYVIAGPAIVEGNNLVFTKIPPHTKFPMAVTVAAWQWGRGIEPKVKTAEIVKQTFQILP